MNDLLLSFLEKGYTFNENNLKDEKIRVNIELQNLIKTFFEAQKMIIIIKSNNLTLQKQKEVLIN